MIRKQFYLSEPIAGMLEEAAAMQGVSEAEVVRTILGKALHDLLGKSIVVGGDEATVYTHDEAVGDRGWIGKPARPKL